MKPEKAREDMESHGCQGKPGRAREGQGRPGKAREAREGKGRRRKPGKAREGQVLREKTAKARESQGSYSPLKDLEKALGKAREGLPRPDDKAFGFKINVGGITKHWIRLRRRPFPLPTMLP